MNKILEWYSSEGTPTSSCWAYPGFAVLFTILQETSVLPEVIIREWWFLDWGREQQQKG